ncbi:hypothetical protein D3C71_78780 [compost metagenome]
MNTVINFILSLYAAASTTEAVIAWATIISVPYALLSCAIGIFGKQDKPFTMYFEAVSAGTGAAYKSIWLWVIALAWLCPLMYFGWFLVSVVMIASMVLNAMIYFPAMKFITVRAVRQQHVKSYLNRVLNIHA